MEVRHGAERHEVLHGLVGGAVFPDPHRVVGPDVDHRQPGNRREPHRGAHVVGKTEERGGEGAEPAVVGDSVCRGPHRVLADSVVQVAAAGVALGLGTEPDQRGLGRTGQIGIPAEELGNARRQRIHGLPGSVAGGQPVPGTEGGKPLVPTFRQAVPETAFQLGGLLRGFGPGPLEPAVPGVPSRLPFPGALCTPLANSRRKPRRRSPDRA